MKEKATKGRLSGLIRNVSQHEGGVGAWRTWVAFGKCPPPIVWKGLLHICVSVTYMCPAMGCPAIALQLQYPTFAELKCGRWHTSDVIVPSRRVFLSPLRSSPSRPLFLHHSALPPSCSPSFPPFFPVSLARSIPFSPPSLSLLLSRSLARSLSHTRVHTKTFSLYLLLLLPRVATKTSEAPGEDWLTSNEGNNNKNKLASLGEIWYIYIYIYIYIYTCVYCTYTYICNWCLQVHVYMYMSTCACVYLYKYVNVYIYTYIYTYIYIYVCIYDSIRPTHMYTHIYLFFMYSHIVLAPCLIAQVCVCERMQFLYCVLIWCYWLHYPRSVYISIHTICPPPAPHPPHTHNTHTARFLYVCVYVLCMYIYTKTHKPNRCERGRWHLRL